MEDSSTLRSGRITRRAMMLLIGAVLFVTPFEAVAYDQPLVYATAPIRAGLLLTIFGGLWIRRISPIVAGRLFLGQAIITLICWAVLLDSTPSEVAMEAIAYGSILPVFALLIAPRHSRRAWALLVLSLVLYPAFARLLATDIGLLTEILATLTVHGVAIMALDTHANRAEAAGEMASIDQLTGLFNRRSALARLHERTDLAAAKCVTSSLILFDLDHFKQINDTLGHEAGDDTLRRVADAVMQLVRPIDSVCRWGGEEFIVLLPDTDGHAAEVTAESLRLGIETTGVTASFGVAEIDVDDTVTNWVRRADDAMYDSKHAGRNCISVAAVTGRPLG